MARKVCESCGIGRPGGEHDTICDKCYDYAGWENTHSDSGHEDIDEYSVANTTFNTEAQVKKYIADTKIEMQDCPVCHPELDRRPTEKKERKGHHSPRRTQLNHRTQCQHAQTPAARRECRTAYWAEQAKKKS